MTKDYEEMWKGVTNATDEAQAVQALAEMLADNEGRTFVSCLGDKDAELCIEILDSVSRDPHFPFPSPQAISLGHRRIQSQNYREASFLRNLEETCRALWTTAGRYGDNRND